MLYASKLIIETYHITIWSIVGAVICNFVIGIIWSLIISYIAELLERNKKQNEQNDKK